METTVFAKKRNTKDGKTFETYICKLTRKTTGEVVNAKVVFQKTKPDHYPINIVFERLSASMSAKNYKKDDETKISYTLFLNDWKEGEPWVDRSLEDFE